MDEQRSEQTNRRGLLSRYLDKEHNILEIGPYWNGLAPKRDGYKTTIIDVFDKEALLERARYDNNIPQNLRDSIETPDIIGSADSVAALVEPRSIDRIISCHNIEHIPNPILFLQECEKILKDDGRLLLAVPDRRTTYDFYRPVSTTAGWVDAFLNKRARPTDWQVFENQSMHATKDGLCLWGYPVPAAQVLPMQTVKEAYRAWVEALQREEKTYVDCHCWVFTPASFMLILLDCLYLELIKLEVETLHLTSEGEFIIVMKRATAGLSDEDYYATRKDLFLEACREASFIEPADSNPPPPAADAPVVEGSHDAPPPPPEPPKPSGWQKVASLWR